MGVRRVSESDTEYKFHLSFHFPSESVKRDVRPVGIVNDITYDNHEISVHLSCDMVIVHPEYRCWFTAVS